MPIPIPDLSCPCVTDRLQGNVPETDPDTKDCPRTTNLRPIPTVPNRKPGIVKPIFPEGKTQERSRFRQNKPKPDPDQETATKPQSVNIVDKTSLLKLWATLVWQWIGCSSLAVSGCYSIRRLVNSVMFPVRVRTLIESCMHNGCITVVGINTPLQCTLWTI